MKKFKVNITVFNYYTFEVGATDLETAKELLDDNEFLNERIQEGKLLGIEYGEHDIYEIERKLK